MEGCRFLTLIQTEFVAGPMRARGKIRNLGAGGLFIRTGSVPEQGEVIRLRFESPGGAPIVVEGLVWWTTDERVPQRGEQGFGVCLLAASPAYRALIANMR